VLAVVVVSCPPGAKRPDSDPGDSQDLLLTVEALDGSPACRVNSYGCAGHLCTDLKGLNAYELPLRGKAPAEIGRHPYRGWSKSQTVGKICPCKRNGAGTNCRILCAPKLDSEAMPRVRSTLCAVGLRLVVCFMALPAAAHETALPLLQCGDEEREDAGGTFLLWQLL